MCEIPCLACDLWAAFMSLLKCVLKLLTCIGKSCEGLLDLFTKFCKCITSCCGSKSGSKTATYLDSYDIDWEASPLKDPGQHVLINVEEYDM